MNQLAIQNEHAGALTPMDMLDRAISKGATIDVLEKLMSLQERYEANNARRAFDDAVAKAKAELPIIQKNRTGHNNKRYADFAALATVVDPIITKHGLSYRFRTKQDERINVTCVLSHKDGHSEENTLSGPADTTGNKNAIQSIGSTLTYLQRYSLVLALGLAASEDDDGRAAAAAGPVTEEQAKNLRGIIDKVDADLAKFCNFFGIDKLGDLPASRYQEAVTMLSQKQGKTK